MTLLAWILAAMFALSPARPHGELASAIAYAVEDERPLFRGDDGQLRTAALLVAVAFRESSFDNTSRSKTGDHCAMQVHARPELANDVDACVRVALEMIRESMRACPGYPLAFYAEGPAGCSSPRAQRISRDRMWLAAKLFREVQP